MVPCCLDRAIEGAEHVLAGIFLKAHFWKAHTDKPFNERQRAMINRLFNDFEGKLTSSKWAKLAKCSQDTALRDIDDLVERGVLVSPSFIAPPSPVRPAHVMLNRPVHYRLFHLAELRVFHQAGGARPALFQM